MSQTLNLEFMYLYRDAGNFKNFGSVVFSNHQGFDSDFVKDTIIKTLIDGTFFSANSVDIPPLFFENFPFDPMLDHAWHEFEQVEMTSKVPTDKLRRDILDLIDGLQRTQDQFC